MSDLFIGEILVLVLLLPVLLRPFSRRMQRVEGIPLLPLLAFLLCVAIIAGMGLRITFLPVFVFSILVFFSGLIRLFRLFRHLPTDWYPPVSVVYHMFLVIVFAGVFFTTFLFAPENGYISRVRVDRTVVVQKVAPGVQARYRVWTSENSSVAGSTGAVVLFLGDISSAADGRSTAALLLAEAGYTVIAADYSGFHDYSNLLFSTPVFRQFLVRVAKINPASPKLTDATETLSVQKTELSRMIQYVRQTRGNSVAIYVLSEGSGCQAVLAHMPESPEDVSGAVCIVSISETATLPGIVGGSVILDSTDKMMPGNAGAYRVLELTGPEPAWYGLGEISCDDVLAAVLLGGTRDTDRKNAELDGRRIITWLSLRRAHDNH